MANKKNKSYYKQYRQADYLARQNNVNPKKLNDALVEGARLLFWLIPTLSIVGEDMLPDDIVETLNAWVDEYKGELLPVAKEIFERDTVHINDSGEIRSWWHYNMPSQFSLDIRPTYTATVAVKKKAPEAPDCTLSQW